MRAAAFDANVAHYSDVFTRGRDEYAIPPGALTDTDNLRKLSAFFFWTAWAASTNRTNDTITYTSNWPHEPLVGNRPTATQLWTLRNDSDWDHPMHLHGYFFMPVDEKGQPLRPMQWKDTINVPMKTTARVLVTFDERPGQWMIHCHILDHADGGLMTTIVVGDAPTRAHVHGKEH